MKRKISDNLDAEKNRLSKLLFRPANFTQNLQIKTEDDYLEGRTPAWVDEDDQLFTANCLMDTKSKEMYTNTLKQKYVNLMGTPKWAKLNRLVIKKDSDGEDDHILCTVGHLARDKRTGLSEGRLELKRFPKINSETGNEGPIIKALEFHPKSSVALVGGQSGIISLFTVGGDQNNKLHSVSLPKFRLLNARFTPDGSDALLSSDTTNRYCNYNLVAAKATLVEFPHVIKKPKLFELSPCGKYLAVADGFDEIHIVCVASRELIRSLKQSSRVEAVTFSINSDRLYAFGDTGTVTVWNMSTHRVEHKFVDNGCISGSCISFSPCGRLLATGSGEGIVNVYETSSLIVNEPIPLHTVHNLSTKITSLKFNSSSEILGLSSSFYPNAIKLVHIPSYHVFSNFPEQSSNFHQIAAFNFSPNSGYLGLSNNKNFAYLYRLKHYKNY